MNRSEFSGRLPGWSGMRVLALRGEADVAVLVQLRFCNGKYSGFIQDSITIYEGSVEYEELVTIMIPLINKNMHSFTYSAHNV